MGYSKVDQSIADYYSEEILKPVKYGENAVFFWFPGSGMTSILKNIFDSDQIRKKRLSNFSKLLEIYYFWGHLSEGADFRNLIKSTGFQDYSELNDKTTNLLESGREIVFVIGRIDNFGEKEKIDILRNFVRLASKNRHRIHIILNSFNKPWFERLLVKKPEFVYLANFMKVMPVIDGKLLEKFIAENSLKFERSLTVNGMRELIKTYGGVIQLAKEYLRNGMQNTVDLKFKVNWQNLPKEYKVEIQNLLLNKMKRDSSSATWDLKEFGVLNLNLFSKHQSIMDINPDNLLNHLLTFDENKFYEYMKNHSNRLVYKDTAMSLLRPENSEEISLWAVDQAVSRFRKKLAKSGIDPDILQTKKGQGYIWKG